MRRSSSQGERGRPRSWTGPHGSQRVTSSRDWMSCSASKSAGSKTRSSRRSVSIGRGRRCIASAMPVSVAVPRDHVWPVRRKPTRRPGRWRRARVRHGREAPLERARARPLGGGLDQGAAGAPPARGRVHPHAPHVGCAPRTKQPAIPSQSPASSTTPCRPRPPRGSAGAPRRARGWRRRRRARRPAPAAAARAAAPLSRRHASHLHRRRNVTPAPAGVRQPR